MRDVSRSLKEAQFLVRLVVLLWLKAICNSSLGVFKLLKLELFKQLGIV
jgi:hypothetical protein